MSKKTTIVILIAAVLGLAGLMGAVYSSRHAAAASDAVTVVKDNNDFQKQVTTSTLPVFIYFTSSNPQCAPCQKQDALIAQAAKDYAGKVKFIEVDAEKNPEIAAANGIPAVPAMFVLKLQEKTMVYYIGTLDAASLQKFIDDGLAAKAPAPGTAPNGPTAPAAPDTNAPATDPTQK